MDESGERTAASARDEAFVLTSSRGFPDWLAASGFSLAFTTYQAGKLFFLGVGADGRLSVFERSFPRAMGLGRQRRRTQPGAGHPLSDPPLRQCPAGRTGGCATASTPVYAPHAAWVTGDLDVHDVGFGADGRPVFVNTLFGCIAAVSDGHSFRPLWTPPLRLAAGGRGSLPPERHGDGRGAAALTPRRWRARDVADGWRDRRRDGGVLIDVATGEIVAERPVHAAFAAAARAAGSGCSIRAPASSASSTGAGRFEPVAFCPGYARGLAFAGGHAIVGLSLPRESRTFAGLALDEALSARERGAALRPCRFRSRRAATWRTGCGSKAWCASFTTSPSCPASAGLPRSAFSTDEVKRVISIES